MTTERFVIDEAGFAFADESPEAIGDALHTFSDLLTYARETGQGVAMSDWVWEIPSASGTVFLDYLVDRQLTPDPDLGRLLASQLHKVRCWDDDTEMEPPTDATVDGQVVPLAPSIALSAMNAARGRSQACLTTVQSGRRGGHEVTLPHDESVSVPFLVSPVDAPGFWRSLVEVDDLDIAGIEGISQWAFPSLVFRPGVWKQANDLVGSFRDVVRPRLLRDLAGLDDYAIDTWRQEAGRGTDQISKVMAAKADVD